MQNFKIWLIKEIFDLIFNNNIFIIKKRIIHFLVMRNNTD